MPSEQMAGEPAQETAAAAVAVHVRQGRGEEDFSLALEDVKRRGTVFAFAANDLALAKMTADHRVLVQLQKGSRDFLEIGKLQQLVDIAPARPAGPF